MDATLSTFPAFDMPVEWPRATTPLAPLRIALTYWWRHGRLPDLDRPTRFTELVQQRKLTDRDPRLPVLADKVAGKAVVADMIGTEWIIPTLWHGPVLPEIAPWVPGFVVKSRHGCNQRAFVRTGAEDWAAIRRRSARWMARRYGYWLDEWLYAAIPRGIVVEPFIGTGGRVPTDYKFYVFGGRVEFVQVHLDREHDHRWLVFDRNWRRVSAVTRDQDPPRPRSLVRMIEAAEILAQDFDFVRVDLYDADPQPLFGEMTFYPGSGLDPFDPPVLDHRLGACWLRARDEIAYPVAADIAVLV